MARKGRRNSRRGQGMKKIEPAVMTLNLSFQVPPGTTQQFTADLSQMASLMNRRFYRQGLNWAVGGFKILDTNANNAQLSIAKLPSTWVFANAWEKGMRHYVKMIDENTEADENIKGRYLDFKIHMDNVHHLAGFSQNLVPFDASLNTPNTAADQWIASDMVVPFGTNAINFEVIGVGANYPGAGASGLDAVSLVQGYANSRSLPYAEDPSNPLAGSDASGVTPENWLQALENEGTTQDSLVVIEAREYDKPPYPYEGDGLNTVTQYPGGANNLPGLEVHDGIQITSTTIGGTSYLKGGNFPCGLIRFNALNADSQQTAIFNVFIDLVPGDHRGYLAEPMTEV